LERRLAAILAADVVGYTRLMGLDEAGTLRRLNDLREKVLAPLITKHHGRIVKLMGDGLLVEFASVVNAVICAIAWQEDVTRHESEIDTDTRFLFRLGINLGDVIVDGGDIHGDGVNVAARLEGLAEPGGICLSGDVYRQTKGKIAVGFEDMGEQNLKNVTEPFRVYRIAGDGSAMAATSATIDAPSLTDKPSIAVLPFTNMSSDPEQDYFADGITEDIITDLSRWRTLAVRSRNSTFQFKGKQVDIQGLGRELDVHFLVEGSVRRMGERVRITVQLINSESGDHIWAERFDRPLADLFAVQDEVVRTIVGTLVGRVYASEVEQARRKPPSSIMAYDHVLRCNALPWDDPASAAEAKRAFERAIEIDPEYGLPCSLLAIMLHIDGANDFLGSQENQDHVLALAKRGVELADNEGTCHSILGIVYRDLRSFELALRHLERSVEINPNNQWNWADLGVHLSHIGRAEESLEILRKARRMDPYFGPPWYWRGLGFTQFVLRRYADALEDFDRQTENTPGWCFAVMAGCCAKLGDSNRARELVNRCLTEQPEETIDRVIAKLPFKHAVDRDHLAECLRLAGMPE
jgi:adenylate cyclase